MPATPETRAFGRAADALRPVLLEPNVNKHAEGSCLARFGDTQVICTATVEEKIQALQQRKAELARAVLEGGSTQALRFDEDDVAELFAPLG